MPKGVPELLALAAAFAIAITALSLFPGAGNKGSIAPELQFTCAAYDDPSTAPMNCSAGTAPSVPAADRRRQ